jgi:hypothetical protein
MRTLTKQFSIAVVIAILTTGIASVSTAKVYSDMQVGSYKSSIKLSDYKGITFLHFMKTVAFPDFLKPQERETGKGFFLLKQSPHWSRGLKLLFKRNFA